MQLQNLYMQPQVNFDMMQIQNLYSPGLQFIGQPSAGLDLQALDIQVPYGPQFGPSLQQLSNYPAPNYLQLQEEPLFTALAVGIAKAAKVGAVAAKAAAAKAAAAKAAAAAAAKAAAIKAAKVAAVAKFGAMKAGTMIAGGVKVLAKKAAFYGKKFGKTMVKAYKKAKAFHKKYIKPVEDFMDKLQDVMSIMEQPESPDDMAMYYDYEPDNFSFKDLYNEYPHHSGNITCDYEVTKSFEGKSETRWVTGHLKPDLADKWYEEGKIDVCGPYGWNLDETDLPVVVGELPSTKLGVDPYTDANKLVCRKSSPSSPTRYSMQHVYAYEADYWFKHGFVDNCITQATQDRRIWSWNFCVLKPRRGRSSKANYKTSPWTGRTEGCRGRRTYGKTTYAELRNQVFLDLIQL